MSDPKQTESDLPVPEATGSETARNDDLDSDPPEVPAKDPISELSIPDQDAPSGFTGEPKKRKLVGFAPEPEEDLQEHHKYVEERRKDRLKSNPFWRIPPELAYLEPHKDKEGPKPIPTSTTKPKPRKPKKLEDMRDMPTRPVKEISSVNKSTAINFNYHEVLLPIGRDRVLVEVRYASLSSFDITKLQKYSLNISNERVGIGHDFVGVIADVGRNYRDSDVFKVGVKVFGCTNPIDRKGSLQTCVIVNPTDVLIPITDDELEEMTKVDLKLSFKASPFTVDDNNSLNEDSSASLSDSDIDDASPPEVPPKVPPKDFIALNKPAKAAFLVPSELEPMAKFASFGAQYCRAKEALVLMDKIFRSQESANILINGADTCLGYTLTQILASSVYSDVLQSFNVILVVREPNEAAMKNLVSSLGSGGLKRFHVVSFDMVNTDLVLPGEKVPINYKKVPFFASEIIDSMLQAIPDSEKVTKSNIALTKLDLFIDIIGSKKMFQKSVKMSRLDEVDFPFKKRLGSDVSVASLFGRSDEPLFIKLMKPKIAGSTFISFCRFSILEPSYSADRLLDYSNRSYLSPWSSKWTLGLANLFVSKYNYYEKFDLEIKKKWIEEGLRLIKSGELRMKIDEVVDWRNNFRKYVDDLRESDGQVIFKLETF